MANSKIIGGAWKTKDGKTIPCAVITQIAAEIERGAGLVASTDPDVVAM